MKHKGLIWGGIVFAAISVAVMAAKAYDLMVKPKQIASSWTAADTVAVHDGYDLTDKSRFYRPAGMNAETYSGLDGLQKLEGIAVPFPIGDEYGGVWEFRYNPEDMAKRNPKHVHKGLEALSQSN